MAPDDSLCCALAQPAQKRRRRSAPARIFTSLVLPLEDATSDYDSDAAPDEEVEAALAIFEDVIEELTQIAEEHEEAREEIAEVAWEVAEAMSHGFEDDDIDDTYLGDTASEDDSANDDVSDDRSSTVDSEERAQRLQMLFLAERDELCNPDMGGTLEDVDVESEEDDTGSVVCRRIGNPLPALQRRRSSSQGSSIIRDATTPRRRASTPDSKASSASCVVAAPRAKDDLPMTGSVTPFTEAQEQPHPNTERTFDRDEAGSWLTLTARPSNYPQGCSPMDKVKTKLAAWSRAGGNGLEDEDAQLKWIRLLPCDDDLPHQSLSSRTSRTEGPLAPPNTERPSGASSAKHSAPQSPLCERDDLDLSAGDVEDDSLLELRVQPSMARPWRERSAEPSKDSTEGVAQRNLSLPPTPRGGRGARPVHCQLSNLALEDEHFKSHRDSLLLLRSREQEAKTNQQLLEARDSIILTKSKFGAIYPESPMDCYSAWSHPRNLSTITDDSPPDSHSLVASGSQWNEDDDNIKPQPEEHKNCAICEVERPRWFAAHCKQGAFM